MASAKRNAKIELTSSAAGVDKGLNDARRKLRGFQRDQEREQREQERAQKRAQRSAMGFGRSVLSGMAAAGGFDIAGGVTGFVGEIMDADKALTRLQITGEMNEKQLADFRQKLLEASTATGVSRAALIQGASAYVAFTGNTKNAQQSLELFGRVAQATGSSMEDVAGIAAMFDKNLHLDPSQWSAAFDVLVKQGHIGGVEMKDLAARFASVASAYAEFEGGSSTKGLGQVSAMAQVLQNMTHDADTTNTYLKDMFNDIKKNAPKLRKFKIEPFTKGADGKKRMVDVMTILDKIAGSPLAKDPELLQKVFPESRGRAAVEYLTKELALVHQIAKDSTDSNQVSKDFDIYSKSSAGRLEAAWNNIKNAIAEALTPERIENFAHAMIVAADAFVKAIGAADTFLSAVGHMAGFDSAKNNQNTALQDIFLNNTETFGGSKDDEARAIQRAKEILGAKSWEQGRQLGFDEDMNKYGGGAEGLANVQEAARRFLVSENMLVAPGQGSFASFMNAVRDGFSKATIVIKADANAITRADANSQIQRTRPGGR